MKTMIAIALSLVTLSAIAAGSAFAADGPGTCGKGKVYNPDTQSCVPKPRSGSGSNSG